MLSNNNRKINLEPYDIHSLSQFKKDFEEIKNYNKLKITLMYL